MKVNELRIGNFISSPRREIDIVKQVNENNVWGQFYEDILPIPIPLTEKWLLDFSFKGRLDFKWNNNVGIQIIDGKYYFAFKDLSNVLFHSIIECKYVHQLQNLYFALTGEELIIF